MSYIPLKRRVFDMSTAQAHIEELETYHGKEAMKDKFLVVRDAIDCFKKKVNWQQKGMEGTILPGDSQEIRRNIRNLKVSLATLKQYIRTMDAEVRDKQVAEQRENKEKDRAQEKKDLAEWRKVRESRLALREKSMAEARKARLTRQDEVKKLRAEIRKLKGEAK